jgi:hypothetical protein
MACRPQHLQLLLPQQGQVVGVREGEGCRQLLFLLLPFLLHLLLLLLLVLVPLPLLLLLLLLVL